MTDQLGISDEDRKRQRSKLEARSQQGLAKRYADQNRESLEEAEAQIAPPVITEKRCHVCQSDHRMWIERQILKGRSYSAIANSMPPDKDGNKIDRRSVSNHYQKHMPLDQAVVRGILEEEADLVGQNWEEGVKGAITTQGMFRVMMQKAFDDAMAGITTIEPRDFIQMAKAYGELVSNQGEAATEEAKIVIRIFMEAIKNVVEDEFDTERADELKRMISDEVKRLRARDEIDMEVERHMPVRELPRGD